MTEEQMTGGVKVTIVNIAFNESSIRFLDKVGYFTGETEERVIYDDEYDPDSEDNKVETAYLIELPDGYGDYFFLSQLELYVKPKKVIKSEIDFLDQIKENFKEDW